MARKFVSPGVFTQELDQSFLASGVGAIGAVVVGRTSKGPALVPTLVTDFNDYVAKFGDVDPLMEAPYAIKNYLKNSSACTVVRVLGDRSAAPDPGAVENYSTQTSFGIVDYNDTLLAVVNVAKGTTFTLSGTSEYPTFSFIGSASSDFTGSYAGTLSFLRTDPNYIRNVLNGDPTQIGYFGHYLYECFDWAHNSVATPAATTAPYYVAELSGTTSSSFDCDFTSAVTPWIKSQNYGSNSYQLFRIHALSAGEASNTDVKVSIANIRKSVNSAVTPYGTFDIIVRGFQDTDGKLIQNETFTNVTLDPTSPNYLPRVIGDQYRYWNSTTQKLVVANTFKNYSKFIRIEMDTGYHPTDALPWAHSGYPQMVPVTNIVNTTGTKGVAHAILGTTEGLIVTTQATGTSFQVVFATGTTPGSAALVGTTATISVDYLMTFGDARALVNTLTGLTSTGYVSGGNASTLIDPTVLPLTYSVTGLSPTYYTLEAVDLSGAYVSNNLDSNNNLAVYKFFGLDFTLDGIEDLLKFPGSNVYAPKGTDFSMHHLTTAILSGVSYYDYDPTTLYTTGPAVPSINGINGFTVGFAGGFDGFDMTQADPLLTGTSATSISTVSLKKAIDLVSNPDEIDINLIAVPGITNPSVTSYVRQMCNARADVMYVMDIDGESVSAAISSLNTQGIDDNYAATYYPKIRYADTTNNVMVTVSPSVAVLGAIAYNDRVGQVFFAPAGLNRGGLSQFGVVDTLDRLTFQDRNDLYESRINPIATFPNEGIVIWGQKTLQQRPSALDRVNVRRLLIYAKKTIASVARYLLFEPNNPNTWQRFLNTVNPILDKVRMDQGLERFKVVMDSSTNTPDLIDRNIMTGKIFLQPTRSAEYIDLSFIITSSGVSFEE
jgi:hypothetical protein